MSHIMVDIETLGTRPGSAILSIGAVRFDRGARDAWEQFYRPVDLFSSLMAGCTIDERTVGWWRGQIDAAKSAAQPPDGRVTLGRALDQLSAFIEKDARVWAKGPDFDLVMLGEAYRLLGKPIPWHYRNARDVRTIMALAPGAERVRAEIEHHALYDAIEQAEVVRLAHEHLGKGLA